MARGSVTTVSNFNEAAVGDVFDRIVSLALSLGRFDSVNQHEPKSAPGNGINCAVWVQAIRPARSSGLPMTSGVMDLQLRVYQSFLSQPFDSIDPAVTGAICDIMGAISGEFSFGGIDGVRDVDLLGMTGTPMSAQSGYVEIDRKMFRVMTLAIPVIINDMFAQVP
jgi:hypothetical protein